MSDESILFSKLKEIRSATPSILLWTIFALYLIWQISFYWKNRNMYIKSWNVPGPINFPIIGAAYVFIVRPEELHNVILKYQKKYKREFKAWIGPRLFYSLAQPQHIEKVLTSPNALEKDADIYKSVTDVIGACLLTAPVPRWRAHRKAIAPSFGQKVLDSFVEIFANKSVVLSDIIEKHIGEELNIFQMSSRCTLDIILETAMGAKMDIQNGNADYAIIIDRCLELMNLRCFQFWSHVDFIWKVSPSGRELERMQKPFHSLINKVIQEKLDAKGTRQSPEAQVDYGKNEKAFLDWIIETTDFTVEELREEVSIFIAAGTDTTAATLSFFFTILGIYPQVQQKVYEEVVEIMGHDRMPQSSDLPLMKYTEKVIKETLRLFPVAAIFVRSITDDIRLDDDLVLPKNSSVLFGTVYIHRNPEFWEDPLKFDPERFSPENIGKIPPGAYLPFALGPRNCIGMKYAHMSMKTVIANVVRRIKFRSEHKGVADVEIKTHIILRYKNGSKLYAEKRSH